MHAPTKTTNMTGLRHWRRGSSLRNESRSAARTSVESPRAEEMEVDELLTVKSEGAAGLDEAGLGEGAGGKSRKKGEGTEDEHHGDEQRRKGGADGGESSGGGRGVFLSGHAAGDGEHG